MQLDPFYPILDLDLAAARGHDPVALARGLPGAKVNLLQLRAKSLPTAEFCRLARLIAPLGPRVVVNDRADVALLAAAHGVHVGQDDLPASAARRLLGSAAIIGLSTHSLRQAEVACRERDFSYLAFGPIFPTATKRNPDPVTGLDELRHLRRFYSGPLVAIGGITLENCRSVWQAGADSVAVIAGWLDGPDPLRKALAFLAESRQSADYA